jgi:predicted lipoprotein with Yx(FWY)xxD motif
MMIRFRLTIAGAVTLLLVGCAGMTYAPVRYTNGLMTGSTGMTLYTFDKDTPYSGKSACNGQCATNWPPFAASSTDQPGRRLDYRCPRRRYPPMGILRTAALLLGKR